MAMAPKMVGAFLLVLLALTASNAQVLPTPCCRFDCGDGKPECCDPGYVATPPVAAAAPGPAVKVGPAARSDSHRFNRKPARLIKLPYLRPCVVAQLA
ncbi:hypothetical protein BRADI_1g70871v3 [Brachypodium distachyon]|uniref:Uncharacterized protein n=1 Tax=Brachypodium distachyon TaxID=15368 RepID=A0A0Q3KF02_BRADI|nr:hypothetical protein BRADI_1g70871v3 [Brachypodium distachyon]